MSHFNKKENREIMDVPTICPICGEKFKDHIPARY
jgi:rRNA maturation protein Nop10